MNKNKLESLNSLLNVFNSYNSEYFSNDWMMKMLNLERNEIRKYKINKLFNDEGREI